ncbi:hypothetical protein [Chitinophaga rhizosphaerae]|uniref:hypothetical protein n=1 Tax=Chitinophaga rhizosphaerae TaxID=1864947 RepID=UPI000F7FB621|nr:hypothetical protein [Chitinophaga rhizosphaerae]
MKNLAVIFLVFILPVSFARAQNLAELERQLDSLLDSRYKSEVTLAVGFGNNPAYGGKAADAFRPINMKPFLSPSVTYTHKSGLFANAAAYYLLSGGNKPWFEFDLGGGYDYTRNRDLMTGISYTRYFYADSSDVPQTPVKNELYAYFIYRKWWLQPGLSLDFGWGSYVRDGAAGSLKEQGNDFNVIADVRHPFLFMDVLKADDGLLIMPIAGLTTGTAKYFSSMRSFRYATRGNAIRKFSEKKNNGRGRGNGNGGGPVTEETETILSDGSAFKPRAVDLGLRVSYIIGKFAISPSFTLFKMLQGPDTSVSGYFTANVSVTF